MTEFASVTLLTLTQDSALNIVVTLASVPTWVGMTGTSRVLTSVASVPGGAVTQEPHLGVQWPYRDTLSLIVTASEVTRMRVTVTDALNRSHERLRVCHEADYFLVNAEVTNATLEAWTVKARSTTDVRMFFQVQC